MKVYEQIFTLRGKQYKVELTHYPEGDVCWTAYRNKNGYWLKIPCFTRHECNTFPITVARIANSILKTYQATI